MMGNCGLLAVVTAFALLRMAVADDANQPGPSPPSTPSAGHCLRSPSAMQGVLNALASFTKRGDAQALLACMYGKLNNIYSDVTAKTCWDEARYGKYIGAQFGECVKEQQQAAATGKSGDGPPNARFLAPPAAAASSLSYSSEQQQQPNPAAVGPQVNADVRVVDATSPTTAPISTNATTAAASPTAPTAAKAPQAVVAAPGTTAAMAAVTAEHKAAPTPAKAAAASPPPKAAPSPPPPAPVYDNSCYACAYCCQLRVFQTGRGAEYACFEANSCFCTC